MGLKEAFPCLFGEAKKPVEEIKSPEIVPVVEEPNAKGIDVSVWNPVSFDWQKAKALGYEFAFVKATEMHDSLAQRKYQDPKFKAHWSNARIAGMTLGAYHYFHPNKDVKTQVDSFVNAIAEVGGFRKGDLFPVLDVESHDDVSPEQEVGAVLAWLNEIEKIFQVKPFIYIGYYYMQELGNPTAFKDYPLWLPYYSAKPKVPKPWENYAIWQKGFLGNMIGSEPVDINEASGGITWLKNTYGFKA